MLIQEYSVNATRVKIHVMLIQKYSVNATRVNIICYALYTKLMLLYR